MRKPKYRHSLFFFFVSRTAAPAPLMRCSFRTHRFSRMWFPGLHHRLVCDALSAPLTDGVGSVLDWEVYFPLAGYAGPGFHNLPSGHIPQDNGSETASSHPAPWQKDVRRGVRRRDRGQRPMATVDPNPKPRRRRDAATVAGYAGPGFHTWPSDRKSVV